jgi:hypothetical protein
MALRYQFSLVHVSVQKLLLAERQSSYARADHKHTNGKSPEQEWGVLRTNAVHILCTKRIRIQKPDVYVTF